MTNTYTKTIKLSNSFGTQLRSLAFATDIFGLDDIGIDMDGSNKTGLLCDAWKRVIFTANIKNNETVITPRNIITYGFNVGFCG